MKHTFLILRLEVKLGVVVDIIFILVLIYLVLLVLVKDRGRNRVAEVVSRTASVFLEIHLFYLYLKQIFL